MIKIYNIQPLFIYNIFFINTLDILMGASLVYLNEPNKEIEHEKGGNDFL